MDGRLTHQVPAAPALSFDLRHAAGKDDRKMRRIEMPSRNDAHDRSRMIACKCSGDRSGASTFRDHVVTLGEHPHSRGRLRQRDERASFQEIAYERPHGRDHGRAAHAGDEG